MRNMHSLTDTATNELMCDTSKLVLLQSNYAIRTEWKDHET